MKRFFAAALAALMLFSLAACGAKEETTVIEATPGDIPVVSDEGTTVLFYHGDENAENIVEEKAVLPEGFEPQDVIDLLISNSVLPQGITVSSWSVDDSGLMTIDFNPAFAEALSGTGSAGEYIIMASTVNSLINNFVLKGVIMTAGGEIVATGHNIYDYEQGIYDYIPSEN